MAGASAVHLAAGQLRDAGVSVKAGTLEELHEDFESRQLMATLKEVHIGVDSPLPSRPGEAVRPEIPGVAAALQHMARREEWQSCTRCQPS